MRVLIVEDEDILRDQLATLFQQAGYAVDEAADGEDGLFQATEYPLDLAVIDLGLPKLDGISLVKKLRDDEKTYPILILTARGRWQDKVEGLDAGGDDYVVKPFHPEEVLARANALIRRSKGQASAEITLGDIVIDTRQQQVQLSGSAITLTAYEYKVLEYLMLHPGQVVSKTTLTEHVYDEDADKDSNTIEVFVGRLRKKLGVNGESPIKTRRGQGYVFSVEAA